MLERIISSREAADFLSLKVSWGRIDMGDVCKGPWVFSITYWQNLNPQGLAAAQGCEVKGNTNGTSLVLSFRSKSLTGSENPWTRWGEGKEEARDPLSKQILPRRYFQLLGAEPSSSLELRCQIPARTYLMSEETERPPVLPARWGVSEGRLGSHLPGGEEKPKIGANIFWPR